jgi:hypothetical protein
MSAVKREKWTEADIDALSAGEPNSFERKGGKLFDDEAKLLGKVAKAVSALANSGGGHLLLGVQDDGVPDGVPPVSKGRTPTRDWLEQVVPNLVDYPLADFVIHVVEPAAGGSRIPAGRQVIVIDVGDSALAPHQCLRSGGGAQQYVYYQRHGGHSVPAPHFYLELLRQRLVGPALEASPQDLRLVKAAPAHNDMFLALRLRFVVHNVGRVAAYKWTLSTVDFGGHEEHRLEDYRLGAASYPPIGGMDSSMRVDDTILPGCALTEDLDFGVVLRARPRIPDAFTSEIDRLLRPVTIRYRLATETSPGEIQDVALAPFLDARRWGPTVHAQVPPSWPTE